jgi:hypothetical protein
MPNTHNVHVIVGEDGTEYGGALQAYDFTCDQSGTEVNKIISGVYITIAGGIVTEHPTNVAGSEFVTKVLNICSGNAAYLRESPTTMGLIAGYGCVDCRDIQTNPMAGDNCTTPMHSRDCDRAELLAKIQDVVTAVNNMQVTVGDVTIDNTEVVNKLDSILQIVDNAYNVEEHYRVTGATPPAPYDTDATEGTAKLFAGGLHHSITVGVENGLAGIEISGRKYKHKAGYVCTFTATAVLANDIQVSAESADAVITIILTK